jgi:hypothetical protein
MDGNAGVLDTLTRGERVALRAVLVRATAAAGRHRDDGELAGLVAAAPIERLPAAAALHRVGGTVLRGLDGIDSVPPAVRAALTALRQRAALNHLVVVGGMSQIREAFDAADLSWLAMKGPVLAARLYPDVGDRAYGDLDLLVSRSDYPRAMEILEELGFAHIIHNWALAERMLAGQVEMTNGRLNIDLHWHLHYSGEDRRPFALDPDAMLERRRPAHVSGVKVSILEPVDELLTLAFHAARSGGHRLIWVKDIERSLAVEEPDLDELVRRCRDERCGPPVGLMLARSSTLLDADVPPETIAALWPRVLRGADRVVCAVAPPIRMNEQPTATRVFTRSVRSSLTATVAEVPVRAARRLAWRLNPPAENETDSPDEKASYLRAVTAAPER